MAETGEQIAKRIAAEQYPVAFAAREALQSMARRGDIVGIGEVLAPMSELTAKAVIVALLVPLYP